MKPRFLIAVVLAFGIGVVCELVAIPLPAPTAFLGGLLILAMTSGFALTGFLLSRKS